MVVMLHGNFGHKFIIIPDWTLEKAWFRIFFLSPLLLSISHFFPENWKRRKARKGRILVELLICSVVALSYLRGTQSRSYIRVFFFPTDVVTKPNQFYLYSLFKTNLLFSMLTKKTFHKPRWAKPMLACLMKQAKADTALRPSLVSERFVLFQLSLNHTTEIQRSYSLGMLSSIHGFGLPVY